MSLFQRGFAAIKSPMGLSSRHVRLLSKGRIGRVYFSSLRQNSSEAAQARTHDHQSSFIGESQDWDRTIHSPWPAVDRSLDTWDKSPRKSYFEEPNELGLGDVLPGADDNGLPSPPVDFDTILRVLQTRDSHAVMKVLLAHISSNGKEHTSNLLKSIPDDTFSEILSHLDPEIFVGRYMELQQEISSQYTQLRGAQSVDEQGCHHFCNIFLNQLRNIIDARQQSGCKLTVADYKVLFKAARFSGNKMVAENAWRAMRSPKCPVRPDLECYNHFLATLCWGDALNPTQRHRLRVVRTNIGHRLEASRPQPTLAGHRVGEGGIKSQVSWAFQTMVMDGIEGSEETFSLMITALGREGDMAGIEAILKRIWNIDVGAITHRLPIMPVTEYKPDSPFYPSEHLLLAVSHVYGINNDIPTAIRLVDFISHRYNVHLSVEIWHQLLQWTHVVSIRRYAARIADGRSTGLLPQEAVSNLWNIMTSPPYSIEPTMKMYDILIGTLLSSHGYGRAQDHIFAAIRAHKAVIHSLFTLSLSYNRSSAAIGDSLLNESRLRDIKFLRLRIARNRLYIRRWVKVLIERGNNCLWRNPILGYQFATSNIPDIVREWWSFIPVKLEYKVATGIVRLHHTARTENKNNHQKLELVGLAVSARYQEYLESRTIGSTKRRAHDGKLEQGGTVRKVQGEIRYTGPRKVKIKQVTKRLSKLVSTKD